MQNTLIDMTSNDEHDERDDEEKYFDSEIRALHQRFRQSMLPSTQRIILASHFEKLPLKSLEKFLDTHFHEKMPNMRCSAIPLETRKKIVIDAILKDKTKYQYFIERFIYKI